MNTSEEELQSILETLDPTTRTLVAEVDLGMQARDFLHSDLGRHLVGCLHQEVLLSQEELNKVWPWRRRRIQDLQNRIWRAQFMLSWLRDLILSGKAADGALQEVEHGD
jgi:hypothetical protein